MVKLRASDGAQPDQFGHSVSISGDKIVVGAFHDAREQEQDGSAYIFEKFNGTWWEVAKLAPSDRDFIQVDEFGIDVSISGDTLRRPCRNGANIAPPPPVTRIASMSQSDDHSRLA